MKIHFVCQDKELVNEAKQAYGPTDELQVFATWQAALAKLDGAELLIVDLLATLTEPHKISGYEEFAAAKMAQDGRKVPLVVIAAPDDYPLDAMVGWPDFVFGMVRRPVNMKIFRRISTWV